jgi:endonuclease III
MATRAAAKREAARLQETLAASMSSPPVTPLNSAETKANSGLAKSSSATGAKKRALTKNKKLSEPVRGDWDNLPHGLGFKGDLVKEEGVGDQEIIELTDLATKKAGQGNLATPESSPYTDVTDPVAVELLQEELPRRGRKKAKLVKDEDFENIKPKKKRAVRKRKTLDTSDEVNDKANELVAASGKTTKERKKKANKYGLTPGVSPFPNHSAPSHEACEEVNRLLSELHGEVKPPETIPPPSMDVTGCGEVPDLLDAILRTRLSANTTGNNSNMSLQGLEAKFGLRTSGIGKGSVNWEAVAEASVETIRDAIKSGGLANTKSKDIKEILETVREENIARRNALVKEKETGEVAKITGAEHENKEAKDMEITKTEQNLLSMDYLLEMTNDEAMLEMTKLPGIGVKTASCVILFRMKRPSFAVDTHVWRHCKMLGWVPAGANRDKTFSHCEVRVPDHLKYSLHQLFVKHGKTCGRCKAMGSKKEYENTKCPIENLVTRPVRKAVTKKRKRVEEDDDDEDEESEVDIEVEDE